MPKENDLEGAQDQGGKHGGQAGMPHPQQAPTEVREGQHKSESEKKSVRTEDSENQNRNEPAAR
jgi:hypothetical protein